MVMSKRKSVVIAAGLLVAAAVAFPMFSSDRNADGEAEPAPASGAPVAPAVPARGGAGADATLPDDTGGGGGGGGGGGAAPAVGEDPIVRRSGPLGVTLIAQIVDRESPDGEPVRARILVENRGKTAIRLCDPAVDVRRRLEMLYRWRDQNHCVLLPPGPTLPLDTTCLVDIPPGRAFETFVDLRPFFDQALGFGEGPFRFRLAYRGEPEAVPSVLQAWNGDSGKVAVTSDLVYFAPVPAWFEELGGDGDLLNGLASRIFLWTPGSPEDDAMLEHVRGLGAPAVGALAITASKMGAPEQSAAVRARKCLMMLRKLGPDVRTTLKLAPSHPAVEMALGIAEDDAREARGDPPPAGALPFRAVGGGADGGTTFMVTCSSPDPRRSFVYSFDAAGTLLVTRVEGTERVTVAPPFTAEQAVELKRTILRARPWTWRAVRSQPRSGEDEMAFSLADAKGSPVWLLPLRADEAREGNPFAADVLRAFRIVVGDEPAVLPKR